MVVGSARCTCVFYSNALPQEALAYFRENHLRVSIESMFANDFTPHPITGSSDAVDEFEEDWAFERTSAVRTEDGWREKSVMVREMLEMPLAFQPWTGHPLWTDTAECAFTPRELDVVNVAFYKYCLVMVETERATRSAGHTCAPRPRWPAWWVDVSQDVSRCPAGKNPPSIHTHSVLYSFNANRIFKGQDIFV